jgi:hypothetical protein
MIPVMSHDPVRFTAFFSYAHQDLEADPRLIEALTKGLETRVNVLLVTGTFQIWQDKERLRGGDIWDATIEKELRSSDILIVLLTPRWIGSSYCGREYTIFENVELARAAEGHSPGIIIPILARDIQNNQHSLTSTQRDLYGRITARQHRQALAIDFVKATSSSKTALLDKIAEDIFGIIQRQ